MARSLLRTALTTFLTAVLLTSSVGQVFHGQPLPPGHEGLSSTELDLLDQGFMSYRVFTLDVAAIHAHVHAQGTHADLHLILGDDHDWMLSLELHDLFAPGSKVLLSTGSGTEELDRAPVSTYRGHLRSDPARWARFSIRPDAVLGYVKSEEEAWIIEPLSHLTGESADDRFVLFRESDLITASGISCGVTEMGNLVSPENGTAKGGNPCRLANISIAADGSMVSFLGGIPQVQNRVTDILNWVDGKYQEPAVNIRYQLVALFISSSTANDPWTTSQDAITLLNSFRGWANGGGFGVGISHAVATLWTRRDIQSNGSSGTVGLAYVAVVCTTNRYNLCEHYTTSMTAPMIVQAHELGHNWSAQHTTVSGNWIMAPTASTANINWDGVTINSMVGHKNSRTCLGSSCLLMPDADFAANSTVSCNGTVAFTDLSTNEPDAWLWDFGDGNSSTTQNPVHTYGNGGIYTVQLTATNSSGESVQIKQDLISVTLPDPPLSEDVELCGPGTAELLAIGTGDLLWYSDPQGGVPVQTGAFFDPSITSTTTWYVESSIVPEPDFGGALSNTIGTGAFFTSNDNWGLLFDVSAPVTLISVKVYANAAGNRTIQLRNAANTLLDSRVVNIPSGESRITLDMDLPVGQQHLLKLAGNTLGLYRNDAGGAFPYNIGGLVSLTETNAVSNGASNYYYYFYDWEVQGPTCVSSRTAVTASVVICTGLGDGSAVEGLVVRPNPSEGHFMIDWSAMSAARPARLEVLNTLGQRVLDASIGTRTTLELDLHGTAGVLLLRLFDEHGGPVLERRLVVQ